MVYTYFPYLASIHINQDSSKLVQPNVSKVSRRMREESLNVFYGRNKFVLDLRGWKHESYPRRWTPFDVFGHWIMAIGDENAARIRHVTFFSHNFRVNIRISNEAPPSIALQLRTNPAKTEVADSVPSWYTFEVAAKRAEEGLRAIIDEISAKLDERPLTSDDFLLISTAIDDIQPFLCRQLTLGYQGAALLEENVSPGTWPNVTSHKQKCDYCGYHRWRTCE